MEIDAIRRETQQTADAYQDLHQRYQAEYGIHTLFETMPMRLGELQVDDKRKSQLIHSIGHMLKETSTPFPLNSLTYLSIQEFLINKWELRCYFKYDQILKIRSRGKIRRIKEEFGGPS